MDMEKKLQGMIAELDAARKKCQDAIKKRPDHVCVPCERAMSNHEGTRLKDGDVWDWIEKHLNSSNRLEDIPSSSSMATGSLDCNESVTKLWNWICRPCRHYVAKQEIPRYATKNGSRVPTPPPDNENLRPIDAKFAKLTVPYQTVKRMGSTTQVMSLFAQTGIHEMTNCIENSTLKMADQLPRRMDDV